MTDKPDPLSNVGLVGIGLLGQAIAARLLQAQHRVSGFDPLESAMSAFEAQGGQPLTDVRQIAGTCRRIVLCLPSSHIVDEVLATMRPHLQPGTSIIDTTTGDPAFTVEIAQQFKTSDVHLMDASVLGSSDHMRAGHAVLMVGADNTSFTDCRTLLRSLSPTVWHVGPPGSGQRMKLVANLVLGLNRAALAEGLHFAQSQGLDLNTVLQILQSGATWSRVMDDKGQRMIEEQFEPQARLSQHLKDVRLILDGAASVGTKLPLSNLHRTLLERVEASGNGELDNSAIIQAWQHPD